jgi:hypothetical protein
MLPNDPRLATQPRTYGPLTQIIVTRLDRRGGGLGVVLTTGKHVRFDPCMERLAVGEVTEMHPTRLSDAPAFASDPLWDAIVREARDWIGDCTWADEIDTDALCAADLLAGVQRHFDGRLREFIRLYRMDA